MRLCLVQSRDVREEEVSRLDEWRSATREEYVSVDVPDTVVRCQVDPTVNEVTRVPVLLALLLRGRYRNVVEVHVDASSVAPRPVGAVSEDQAVTCEPACTQTVHHDLRQVVVDRPEPEAVGKNHILSILGCVILPVYPTGTVMVSVQFFTRTAWPQQPFELAIGSRPPISWHM